jgi:methylenetetrahydrofolate dehydrogenase (NADP+)/methenyltetrahydrofolate cyclohydrolase
MTIAFLMKNTIAAAAAQHGLRQQAPASAA